MTLLRELIEIPEQIHRGDFVLKLADGVRDPAGTLRDYVITEGLVTAFDQALGLIKSACESSSKPSKAAFLHGSFGSGKSHFMAVLHLLLAQDPHARSRAELAPVLSKHRWLDGKKFLLVPFHMSSAQSLETALFSGYTKHVAGLHPGAQVPAVYLAEPVLAHADRDLADARGSGREAEFFARLDGEAGEGWGDLRERWTAERYAAARHAPAGSDELCRLIAAVTGNLYPAYGRWVQGDDEKLVPIDEGLAILTGHAKELGYDALIFFLDEVILWLASRFSDRGFVEREGAKLAKLVESQGPARAIPIVSFLARQRDLRELVGQQIPGAEQLNVFDVLKWWEDRFDTVRLEDRNLPAIVEGRILRPRSREAKQRLDDAFAATRRMRAETFDTLLARDFKEEDFRRVYPFSPALVQALVAVSGALQRERTAIRVLMQLLVEQRDTLAIERLVPVGDLWDAISDGDEPFNEAMRVHFESCKKLHRQKLLPRILADHGLNLETWLALPAQDPRRMAVRADERLVKTLLLAALAPEAEALKDLSVSKLVALNHGSIRSPIPGDEVATALAKLSRWAADVEGLRVSVGGADPKVSLQVLGVDTDSVIQRARQAADNVGARRAKVRELLFEQFGIPNTNGFHEEFTWTWRGTARVLEVVYLNVREAPTDSLRPSGEDWRLVIDFPFDEGFGPEDDLRRVEEARSKPENRGRTACWIPAFLSSERIADLGRLVALDYALATESRFYDLASHLSPDDRERAKSLLDGQRDALRLRLIHALESVYGIGKEDPASTGASLELSERFQCLHESMSRLVRPAVPNLRAAIEALGAQMLELEYPKHPHFAIEVRVGVLKKVWDWIQRAARDPGHRVVVDRERRKEVKAIVEPLQLGDMGEDALQLRDTWRTHFEAWAARAPEEAITVRRLRAFIDEPEPRGLPREVQDLLILYFAEISNRRFLLHGGRYQASLDRRLDDELELRAQPLPTPEQWAAARERAERMFGVRAGELRGAANVGDLIAGVREAMSQSVAAAAGLPRALEERLLEFRVAKTDAKRWACADAVVRLCTALERCDDEGFVPKLAAATAPAAWEVMGASFKQAASVTAALANAPWDAIGTALGLGAAFADEAKALRERIVQALCADQLAVPLETALRELARDANALVKRAVASAAPKADAVTPTPSPKPTPSPSPGRRLVESGERKAVRATELRPLAAELEKRLGKAGRTITLRWEIEEDGTP
jgi:hypothetical protein